MKLLTTQNHKTTKGEALGYLTGILYLAPAKLSGFEVCPGRSKGCTKACLFTAGFGRYSKIQNARIKKTEAFFKDRENFLSQLHQDINSLRKKAKKLGMIPTVRLNGTSDIEWTRFGIMEEHSDIQFYDYTKVFNRLDKPKPKNYHLTFSKSEVNEEECVKALRGKHNVAVVFDELPKKWKGFKVIDGDQTDLRFRDRKGYVIGLRAKGRAKKDESGFVVKNPMFLHGSLMVGWRNW